MTLIETETRVQCRWDSIVRVQAKPRCLKNTGQQSFGCCTIGRSMGHWARAALQPPSWNFSLVMHSNLVFNSGFNNEQ